LSPPEEIMMNTAKLTFRASGLAFLFQFFMSLISSVYTQPRAPGISPTVSPAEGGATLAGIREASA
jgi:hypothetical protein